MGNVAVILIVVGGLGLTFFAVRRREDVTVEFSLFGLKFKFAAKDAGAKTADPAPRTNAGKSRY